MKPLQHYGLGLTLLLAATGAALDSAAQNYYHWEDAQGNPMLSDRPPPPGVEYQVSSTPVRRENLDEFITDLEDETGTELEDIAESEDELLDSSEQPPAEATPSNAKAEQCAQARANLEALSGGEPVTVRDDEGKARTLSREEIEIQLGTTRAQIKVYCEEES